MLSPPHSVNKSLTQSNNHQISQTNPQISSVKSRHLPQHRQTRYIARMTQNPPNLRPDLARSLVPDTRRPGQPTIGMVSLGCPKALVDSERILTRLRAEGYAISPDYTGGGCGDRQHLRLS